MSDGPAASIALIREADVGDDRLRDTYRDIKHGFRVPLVEEPFQAWAAMPRFLELVWRRLRPNILSSAFIDNARSLAEAADRAIAAWPIGDHAAALRGRGVGETDIRRMREIAGLFWSLDHKLIIVVHAVRLALEGEDIGGAGVREIPQPDDERRDEKDFRGTPVTLVDERDAPFRARTILDALKAASNLSFVPSEYRAMAAFPDWIDVWWSECRQELSKPRYVALRDELALGAIERARLLPYRVRFSPDVMAGYKIMESDRRRLIDVTRALCDAFPGLCVNVSVARRGLGQPT